MRYNNIPPGTLYHKNPKGTCNLCDKQLSTILAPNSTLTVIPPENAVAPDQYWFDTPKTYVGNEKPLKLPK